MREHSHFVMIYVRIVFPGGEVRPSKQFWSDGVLLELIRVKHGPLTR